MNGNNKIPNQRIELIALADCVPTNYQRPTSDSQVAEIVKDFNEAKLGTLTVSLRDGAYHIVDGLHRSKAMKALGYTHAYCVVLTDRTYEQEADMFRKQDQNNRNLMTFDGFNAGLESKDKTCLRINEIVKANDFEICKGVGFFKIASIQALFTIVKDFGFETLDDTLCLIANTWSGIAKASQCESLLGVAEFVSRYGMADFAERLKDKFFVVFYDYTEAMRARGSISSAISRRKFCHVLVEHYNKGLNGNSKKRLKWEESA